MTFFERVNRFLSSAFSFLSSHHRSTGAALLSVGIAGIGTYFLSPLLAQRAVLLREAISSSLETGNGFVSPDTFSSTVFFISVLAVLLAPLIIFDVNKKGIKISVFLIWVVLDLLLYMMTVILEKGDIFFVLVTWGLLSYSFWLFTGICREVYQWIIVKDDKRFDIPKLTLLWTILAFILGKVF